MKLQNMKRGETTEQITLFNWAENNKHILPCLSLMYHIPNEGKRTNGGSIKGHGSKERCAGRMFASAKPQFQRPLPGNKIREE